MCVCVRCRCTQTCVVLLMEEILHQLICSLSHFIPWFTGFSTSQVVVLGFNRMSHGFLEGICNMALSMPRAVSTNTFGDQTLRLRVWELGRSHPSVSNVVIFVGFTVKTTHIWFVSWESWFNEMFNLGEVSLEKRICTSIYMLHIDVYVEEGEIDLVYH